jgi:hypothetical protein
VIAAAAGDHPATFAAARPAFHGDQWAAFGIENAVRPGGADQPVADITTRIVNVHDLRILDTETRSSTHFFWNYLHDFELDNPNMALSWRKSLEEAFNEDLAIIEEQQKVFDADPNTHLLAIGADAALNYFRWALARRIETEKNAARAA